MRSWLHSDYLTTPSTTEPARSVEGWPEDVRELLDRIQTLEALEVMCLLARDPTQVWTSAKLAAALSIDREMIDDGVRHLARSGLVVRRDDEVQAAIAVPKLGVAMAMVCRLYENDRPNVIGAIAQLSIERVRATAARTLFAVPRRESDET